jgi:preprotein translocase subunit SecG
MMVIIIIIIIIVLIFIHVVQTGSGAHSASYPMCTGGSFTGGKASGAWNWPLTSN